MTMPAFAGELSLEFCDVETTAVSRDEIVKAARTTPRDPHDWFMTLRRDDDHWMDATMDDDTPFGIRYGEGGKTYEVSGLDAEKVEAAFVSFYENDGAWRTLCAWKEKPKQGFVKKLFS